MSDIGFFAVHRGVWDHPSFAPEPFTEREAWFWMLSSAAWECKSVRVGRAVVELKRGQLAFSLRFLAEKFRWSEARVRRRITRMISDALIEVKSTREATLITICNYDKYQLSRRTDDTSSDAPTEVKSTHQPTQRRTNNNLTNNNSVANATDAGASDPRARLFTRGLAKLASLTGKGPDSCRSFLGKCLKEAGDDAIVVLAAIEDAERNQVIDPSAYIARLLKGRSNGQTGSKIIQAADDLRRKIASFDGPPSNDGPVCGGQSPPVARLLSSG